MPFTLTLKSAVMPPHFWEVTITNIARFFASGSPESYERSYTVAHDNALPNPSIVPNFQYVDTSLVYGVGTTNTFHNEVWGSGDEATIVFPAYQPAWGAITSVVPSLSGNFTTSSQLIVGSYATPYLTIEGFNSTNGATAAARVRPKTPGAGEDWLAGGTWRPLACGSPLIVNEREPKVARLRYKVCDPAYLDFTNGTPPPGWNGVYGFSPDAIENFAFDRAWDSAMVGGTGLVSTWANNAWGLTKTVQIYSFPSASGELWNQSKHLPAPFGVAYEEKQVWKVRYYMSGFQLVLDINFDGTNAPNDPAYNQVGLDCFDDIVACCWQTAPSGGKKAVLIGIQRGLEKHIGTGSGSTAGWDIYNYADIDQRSPIGFMFLPNGWLFLSFNIYDGSGNATAYYTVNKQHGEKPASNWSAVATLTPNVAQALGIGRSMGQAFRTRVA